MTRDLGELCEFILDGTHGSPVRTESGIPVLSATNVVGGRLLLETERFTSEEEYLTFKKRLDLRVGDVLMTIVGTIGRLAVVDELVPLVFQRSVAVLRPRRGVVEPRYLYHALSRTDVQSQLVSLTNQSAQAGVYLNKLKVLKVPVVALPEQRRVAAILDTAEAIRYARSRSIGLTNELLRSTFWDFFGDPIVNSKGWRMGTLNDLCRDVVDCPHSTPTYSAERTPYACLRSSDIQDGYLCWTDTKYVDEAQYLVRIARTKPMPDDVIYCREGARFGNAARITGGVEPCLGQRMMLFRVAPDVATPEYLWGFLCCERTYQQAVKRAGGSASPHVNVADIRRFEAAIPPLPVQQLFSAIVKRLDSAREKMLTHAAESQALFDALMQSVFSSESLSEMAKAAHPDL